MARRQPHAHRAPINHEESLPPPSTLAAQIVHNQTRPAPAQPQDGRATLKELLHEILHNQAAVQEKDINVNAQLISVVAEAGLVQPSLGNPFEDQENAISQAADSLAVIEKTIRQQPEVLHVSLADDGPQVLLLLLARLFDICGRPRCHDLGVAQLLSSALHAMNKALRLSGQARALREIIQECVDELLPALEAISTELGASTNVILPPARSVARVWSYAENAIAVPHHGSASISDLCQMYLIALQLLRTDGLDPVWHQESQNRILRVAMKVRPLLEQRKVWEYSLKHMLELPLGWLLAADLLQDLQQTKLSSETQQLVARSLIQTLRRHESASIRYVLPTLSTFVNPEAFDLAHVDLKIAVVIWYGRFVLEDSQPRHITAMRSELRQDNLMVDSVLQPDFKELCVSCQLPTLRYHDRKRRKISSADSGKGVNEISTASATAKGASHEGILTCSTSRYTSLTIQEKYTVWETLANLAASQVDAVSEAVARLISLPDVQKDKKSRIVSLLAMRECVVHLQDSERMALAASQFGKICLSSLSSSLRELRIAAGETLPSFLRNDLPDVLRVQNRQIALEFLRSLSDRNMVSEQETLVIAWGQVALACGEKELNLVLLRLVDYLGHSNSLVCAIAFTEIEKIAVCRKQSVRDLFAPFWRSVAVSVVQDLLTKPQKIQQVCDLLEMNVNQFLNFTQRETLPYLVLTRKKPILQRIAACRGKGTTVEDICLQPRTNLAAILTLLLMQSTSNVEASALDCLIAVAPGFTDTDISALVKFDPALIACEMLKHCGDESSDRKSKAYEAFQTFAHIAERTPSQRRTQSKSNKHVSDFFEKLILGILTLFSTMLEPGPGTLLVLEKNRCLQGIAEMFTLARDYLWTALPQIRACLQSGLSQPELSNVAFSAWLSLVAVLNSEEIADIVDETFVLVVRHWDTLSSDLQQRSVEMISNLVKEHNVVLRENIMSLPSLGGIPLLSKFAAEFGRLKALEVVESHCKAFTKRLRVESEVVVLQALTEVVPYLDEHQSMIHEMAASENPTPVLPDLLRALLDVTVKHSSVNPQAASLCGKALGIIGVPDTNQVEATRKKRRVLVLSNFEKGNEAVDWVMTLFEDILVRVFKSVTNAKSQGFLAFVMQELLRFCNFNEEVTVIRPRSSQISDTQQRWNELPENVRTTLTPLLTSCYVVTSNSVINPPNRTYPGFSTDTNYSMWLKVLTYDLMFKANGEHAKVVFSLLARIIRPNAGHDISVARYILPYAVLNVVIGGTVTESQGLCDEFLTVLTATGGGSAQEETIRLCSESVFAVLDYMSAWLLAKRKLVSDPRTLKNSRLVQSFDLERDMAQIDTLERFMKQIPAEIIATRAIDCRSYSRALFHWEQYIRQVRSLVPSPSGRLTETEVQLYDRLQEIYSQIDEPDGLEGVSARLPLVTEQQQAANHAKAGRWTAAQAWYELKLNEDPARSDLQHDLLRCLRETGQYAPLLRYADSFSGRSLATAAEASDESLHLSMTVEACWMTEDFGGLKQRLHLPSSQLHSDFNVRVGRLLLLAAEQNSTFGAETEQLRRSVSESFSMSGTDSLQACHDELLKLHVIYEIEALANVEKGQTKNLSETMEKRLTALGASIQDKQYILGIRRAVMCVRQDTYQDNQTGALWLSTARLARQSNNITSAYNAVMKASSCGNKGAELERARLLWHEGHQRQAIGALEAAIVSEIFETPNQESTSDAPGQTDVSDMNGVTQNFLSARAHLLLAKWLDKSGQSQTKDMTARYQTPAKRFQRWEKGHYYLGKHYSKLLDAQKALPPEKRLQVFYTGEMTKSVIDNTLRSIAFGNKYWHETIPRVLTLYFELGMDAMQRLPKEDITVFEKRVRAFQGSSRQLQKYADRVPSYVFYHALPQLISRITHPNLDVWRQLCDMLVKIVSTHPSQALWGLFAVVKAADRVRVERGSEILQKLKDPKLKGRNSSGVDLRTMIVHGQRLSDGLLLACEAPVEPKVNSVSLAKDLGFNHKLAPSNLVVPIEATLVASSPSKATNEVIRRHKAFAQDAITINSFLDDVLVLSSLQRPRKITVRGSDGKLYGLLCKPKDDLRKDQRLMEFNGIINRALKRSTGSSTRRLYIKTYAVTPLSEQSGTIEWVEGIKPIRDILLNIYTRKGIRPNYAEIKRDLDEACSSADKTHLFQDKVLSKFPPSLHEWFTETYAEPETWFAARLRYARSAAVMSMTGHVLGLGDRHGENILLEESTGGVFHVDFNCLFDKGLTFEKPELVPFRLTHNMVDAMGAYGYEGPFRKSCELTMNLLRQEKDTLMTVLETFLYDPTTDFVGSASKKKRANAVAGVPETPAEILESVSTKLKGLLRGETVPLSVEGYVDALILEATDAARLAAMYIGWCPFM